MLAPVRQAAALDALEAVSRAFDQAADQEFVGAMRALTGAEGPFQTLAAAHAAREAAGSHLNGLRAAVDGAARLTVGVSDEARHPMLRAAQDVRHAIGELRLAAPRAQGDGFTLGLRADAVDLSHGLAMQELNAAENALAKLLGISPGS